MLEELNQKIAESHAKHAHFEQRHAELTEKFGSNHVLSKEAVLALDQRLAETQNRVSVTEEGLAEVKDYQNTILPAMLEQMHKSDESRIDELVRDLKVLQQNLVDSHETHSGKLDTHMERMENKLNSTKELSNLNSETLKEMMSSKVEKALYEFQKELDSLEVKMSEVKQELRGDFKASLDTVHSVARTAHESAQNAHMAASVVG